ncbi:MAG: TlpA disulfide reductase family protein [Gammaproteobacteria bacterium]|nr:TlpA disulfide reductase family protein [Gammaproteobacteria bacterium]
MNRTARLLLPLALLLGLVLPAAAAPLTTFDGEPADLANHTGQGQWTVVKIWVSDCPVCNSKAHRYVAFHAAHRDHDATMLGISLDGRDHLADAEAFVARHGLNYPNLIIDLEGGMRLFHELTGTPLNGTPAFLLYSPEGELVAQQVGAVPVNLVETFIGSSIATGDGDG